MPMGSNSSRALFVMLPGQHLRGRHQRRLHPGSAPPVSIAPKAMAVLPLPTSPCTSRAMGRSARRSFANFHKAPAFARPVGGKRSCFQIFRFRPPGECPGARRFARAAAEQGQGHLIQQQLLKGNASPGRGQRLPTFRENGRCAWRSSARTGRIFASVPPAARPATGPRKPPAPRSTNCATQRFWGTPGMALVHGHESPRRVSMVGEANCSAPRRISALPYSSSSRPRGSCFFSQGWLYHTAIRRFRAIGDIHPGNQKPPGPLFGGVPRHLHPVGGAFPGLCLAQGRTFPQIPIFPGQIHHQFPYAGNARVCQGLQAGRADALYFTQGEDPYCLLTGRPVAVSSENANAGNADRRSAGRTIRFHYSTAMR